MAYDKVVDSAALESNLTSVANAIRTASDATGNLAFPAGFVSALQNMKMVAVVRTVTIASDITGSSAIIHPLLTGDEFIKKHYADDDFAVVLLPAVAAAAGTNVIHFNYHGNGNMGASNVARYGIGLRSTNASTVAQQPLTAKINGSGYSQHMRVNSAGNLNQYIYQGYVLKAGTYRIVLISTEG